MHALAAIYGLFLWAAASALVWLFGAPLFNAGVVAMLVAYALTVPAIWALMRLFWRVTATMPEDRTATGVLIAIPGLLFDAFVMLGATTVFPDLSETGARAFAGWLLWAYGVACVVAVQEGRRAD